MARRDAWLSLILGLSLCAKRATPCRTTAAVKEHAKQGQEK